MSLPLAGAISLTGEQLHRRGILVKAHADSQVVRNPSFVDRRRDGYYRSGVMLDETAIRTDV